MKKVFSKSEEVINEWFNRKQDYARSSGNRIFFEGDNIYSYGKHYQIAKRDDNRKIVLLNGRKNSRTTEKQKSKLETKALLNGFDVVLVVNFEDYYKNIEWMKSQVTKDLISTIRSRKYSNNSYQMFKKNIIGINKYIKNFDLQVKKFTEEDFITEEIRPKLLKLKLLGKI